MCRESGSGNGSAERNNGNQRRKCREEGDTHCLLIFFFQIFRSNARQSSLFTNAVQGLESVGLQWDYMSGVCMICVILSLMTRIGSWNFFLYIGLDTSSKMFMGPGRILHHSMQKGYKKDFYYRFKAIIIFKRQGKCCIIRVDLNRIYLSSNSSIRVIYF